MVHGTRAETRPAQYEFACDVCRNVVKAGEPSVGFRNDNVGHASKNSNWDRMHEACAPSYKVPELIQPPFAFRSLAAAPPPNALQTSMAAAPTAEAPSEARLNLYQSAALLAGLTTAA